MKIDLVTKCSLPNTFLSDCSFSRIGSVRLILILYLIKSLGFINVLMNLLKIKKYVLPYYKIL
jgi:hypothetical protein